MGTAIVLILVALTVAGLLWVVFTAQRLNRLHIRTDSARHALEAALNRRAAVASAIYPELRSTAQQVEDIGLDYHSFEQRADKERQLAAALRGVEGDRPEAIIDAEVRLQLAQRFYNDAVTDTRALRVRPIVRVLRLGGTAGLPIYFELSELT